MKKNVEDLWEALLKDTPEVDESVEITSAMINQQTLERMMELMDEGSDEH